MLLNQPQSKLAQIDTGSKLSCIQAIDMCDCQMVCYSNGGLDYGLFQSAIWMVVWIKVCKHNLKSKQPLKYQTWTCLLFKWLRNLIVRYLDPRCFGNIPVHLLTWQRWHWLFRWSRYHPPQCRCSEQLELSPSMAMRSIISKKKFR